MTISPDTPQNMRNVLVHEGMHRRQSGQRGYSPNPERAGKFPGGAMAPYGERQEEQYANLGKSVYNLLAGNVPQNLDSALTSIDSRYPKSESSAREVAQDLIAGMRPPQAGRMYSTYLSRRMPTDSVPSVFQEHPLREALATKGNVQRVSAEEFAGRFKRK
jgi:hypothetical protein